MSKVFDDNDDDERPEFDESQSGPEYWMHKKERFTPKLSRCIKCNMKQELCLDDDGVWAICLNSKCDYVENIIDWKV